MGPSVEGLKLRRMRIRNEISFNRSTEGRREWAEDMEALREELRRVSNRSRKPNSRGRFGRRNFKRFFISNSQPDLLYRFLN